MGRRLAAPLVGLAIAGCAAPTLPGTGGVQLVLPATRQIQYVSTDLRALRVTVTRLDSGQAHVKTFPGSALIPSPSGSRLSFAAENLPPGPYRATLEAFLDEAATLPAGSSSSEPFAIAAQTTTPVPMPSLTLAPTPVGDWRLTVVIVQKGGYKVEDYHTQLQLPSGGTLAGPAGATMPSGHSFAWGNLPPHPSGVATTSLTLTAATRKGEVVTKTRLATISLLPDATVSSTVDFTFP